MKSKTLTSGQLLLIASRILVSMYNSRTATLQDAIDSEENFLFAERNHYAKNPHPLHYPMFVRARCYIKDGIGRRTAKNAR